MNDRELRILTLDECKYCKELKERLEIQSARPVYLDANKASSLADYVEGLLDTYNYPIAIIEKTVNTYYVYRPDRSDKAGVFNIGPNVFRVGCLSMTEMANKIFDLVNSPNS